jgi:hypothetical protein
MGAVVPRTQHFAAIDAYASGPEWRPQALPKKSAETNSANSGNPRPPFFTNGNQTPCGQAAGKQKSSPELHYLFHTANYSGIVPRQNMAFSVFLF